MTENFKQLLEGSFPDQVFRIGAIIRGTVVRIEKDRVVIDANLKSEGLVPIEQFYSEAGELEVSVGDQVDVSIESLEDGFGETRLSREKAKRAETWSELQEAYESGSKIKGFVTGKVKGGFTVELGSVRGFLPGSLVDVRPVRDSSVIEGKELEFKVIKLDPKRNNIVLSRRAVLELEDQAGRKQLLTELKEGQVVKGSVKNLTDYGAFIDLGHNVDGLLHITDISWKRIKHPREVLAVGDELNVRILKIDEKQSRVSLGYKQLGDDPWTGLAERYPIGKILKGKVTNVTEYGCFVEIEEGVEGLVHISEMDWTNKNINPHKLVQANMEIEVAVLDINIERRRISLGIKQCLENPWQKFAKQHVKGESIKGKIKSITDFGLFVGLPGDIDGLVHLTNGELLRKYKKNEEIEVTILNINPEHERISLDLIKQPKTESSYPLNKYKEDQWVTGKITEITEETIKVDLGDEAEAEIKKSELGEGDEVNNLKVEQVIKARISSVDCKNNRVLLSLVPLQEESST